MRVLLDHNLPHKLRAMLAARTTHEIVTASFMGWGDLKNGELLRIAEEDGFSVFAMGDRSLSYEQNLTSRCLAIVALSANNWPIVKDYVAEILTAIHAAAPALFRRWIAAHSAGSGTLASSSGVTAATPGSYPEVGIPLSS